MLKKQHLRSRRFGLLRNHIHGVVTFTKSVVTLFILLLLEKLKKNPTGNPQGFATISRHCNHQKLSDFFYLVFSVNRNQGSI